MSLRKYLTYPISLVVCSYITGIFLWRFYQYSFSFIWLVGLLILAGIVYLLTSKAWIQTLIILNLFVLAGYTNGGFIDQRLDHIKSQILAKKTYRATVLDQRKSPKGYRLTCCRIKSTTNKRFSGKINVHVADSTFDSIIIGQSVGLGVKYSFPISMVSNPYEFNYGDYCYRQGIFAQVYVDAIVVVDSNNQFDFLRNMRSKALNWIDDLSLPSVQKSLVLAMTLGYKGELSPELREEFSQTGLAHILAVSGLHVGLVYGLIIFLINCMRYPFKLFSKSWFLLTIPVLWLYAYLAGYQDSVVRACLMLSIYVLNRYLLKKDVIAIEAIMFAMLILLIADPRSLFDVGFQLSFAAVVGLICCMNYWSSILEYHHPIIRYILSMFVVSTIATLYTAPFLIMHFHSFSAWSPFSSLLGIPIAFMMIVFSALAVIPSLGQYAELALIWITAALKSLNDFFVEMGFLYFENLWWAPFVIVGAICSLLAVSVGFLEKNKLSIFIAIGFAFLSIIGSSWNVYKDSKENVSIIYHDFKNLQIDFINDGTLTSVVFDGEAKMYNLPNRHYVSPKNRISVLVDHNEIFHLDSFAIQYIKTNETPLIPEANVYLIGKDVSYIPFEALDKKTLILTVARSTRLANLLKSKQAELNIRQLWDIKEQGPYYLAKD